MSFYERVEATARRLLTKYGKPAELVRLTEQAYNPETGTIGSDPAIEDIVLVEVSYGNREIDGTVIQQGDKKFYTPALDLGPPQAGDTVKIGSVTYRVVSCNPLNPGGLDLMFEVQGRR